MQELSSTVSITAYMDGTYTAKKYGADKIVLLGFFIIGLLIARFITSSRYIRPLKAGRQVVAEIKRKGIASFLANQSRQSFFLIKDARGHPVGFTMDVSTDSMTHTGLNIQSASLLYIRGKYSHEKIMFFQSDNSFDRFSWKSETVMLGERSGTEILRVEDGTVAVAKSGRNKTHQTYKPDPASIPDFLLDFVFTEMLEGSHAKIIVDTINADGKMVDVVISRIKTKYRRPSQTEAEYKLNVSFSDDGGFSEVVYLDSQSRILEIFLEPDGIYFVRTNVEDILEKFPERADYILQREKILEQS